MKKTNCLGSNIEDGLRKITGIDMELQNRTLKNVRKHNELIIHMRENLYGKRKVVQAQFKTIGCRMKRAGSCWNCNYGVIDKCLITPNQYINSFEEEIQKYDGNVLVLESLGSITDPVEFDRDVFKKILEIAIEDSSFSTILIETHLTQIDEEITSFVSALNYGRKNIGFEIGIEDMNPEHRKLINKIGVKNDRIESIYKMLESYGIGLDINLIYGFPFMDETERIDAVVQSVKSISTQFPKSDIVIFLMSIKENTIMEYMYQKGIYQPANPWGLVEATRQILEDESIENLITFSWFGEKEDPYIKEQTCYTCPKCKKLIIDLFKRINGTFDGGERKAMLSELLEEAEHLECGCYEKFKQMIKISDGKNPKVRYNQFISSMKDIEI